MKIAVYIGDLLYDYECVVIPGLGGFLSRDYPASVHPVKHYFSPPHREIVFNPWLRANDGLLLNHIALNEKLPYHEAKSKLDRFVLKCLAALGEGKRINFRNVGSIYYDKDQQLVFEPDTHQNYLPDAFGLTGFVSPPVKRDDSTIPREPIFARPARKPAEVPPPPAPLPRTEPKRPMVASRRPSNLRRQLIVIGTAAAALLAGAAYMNKGIVSAYYQQYVGQASILPLFYASPGEYLLMHMDKLPKDMILISKDLPQEHKDNGKVKKADDNLQPARPYRAEPNEISEPETEKQDVTAASNESPTVEMGYSTSLPGLISPRPSKPEPKAEAPTQAEPKAADVVENTASPVRQPVNSVISSDPQHGFYIVAGAFREKANAEKLVTDLRKRQFNASITGRTAGGLWRVTYERLDNRAAAMDKLSQIKQNVDNQAWLLVI